MHNMKGDNNYNLRDFRKKIIKNNISLLFNYIQ